MFPKEFSENLDKYKFTEPIYVNLGVEQIGIDVYCGEAKYGYIVSKGKISQEDITFVGLENAETITINNIDFFVFDFGNLILVMFEHNDFCYDITSSCPYEDMIKIIESIK